MQDNNLRIAFDYKYPDHSVLIVYEIVKDSIQVRKTFMGGRAVKIYSQLTDRSIPDIHKQAGNTNWGAYNPELAKKQVVSEE